LATQDSYSHAQVSNKPNSSHNRKALFIFLFVGAPLKSRANLHNIWRIQIILLLPFSVLTSTSSNFTLQRSAVSSKQGLMQYRYTALCQDDNDLHMQLQFKM